MNTLEKYSSKFEIKFDSGRSYSDYTLIVTHKETKKVYMIENAANVVLDSFLENILISLRDEKLDQLLS